MMGDWIDVAALLKQYGLHTNKNLGQNFLKDRSVLEQICQGALPFGKEGILEIGAGVGSLTALLCEESERVLTVEIDESLKPLLLEQVPHQNHHFLWKDILACDYSALRGEYFSGKPFTIVGNLPYYITAEILDRLFLSADWNCAVLMVQKEAAERLLSRPGSKEYRAQGVFLQAFYEGELLFEVPPHCFQPAPHVWSAVIRLLPKEPPVKDRVGFAKFLKSAFLSRRKMFASSKAVQQQLRRSREELSEILRSIGIEENARAETFSPDQFAKVYNLAQKNFLHSAKL